MMRPFDDVSSFVRANFCDGVRAQERDNVGKQRSGRLGASLPTPAFLAKWPRLCLLLITLFAWTNGAAIGQTSPIPPIEFPFDVSALNAIERTILVEAKRPYHFNLNISYADLDEQQKLSKLVGSGAHSSDGKFDEPGIAIPVHLQVFAVANGSAPRSLYDNIVDTHGHYINGSRKVGGGDYYYARAIASIMLVPGVYKVQARTMAAIPEFTGLRTSFSVTYDSRFSPAN